MYHVGNDHFTTCPACLSKSSRFTTRHHALVHSANEHLLMFCAECGYIRRPFFPTSFPGDPAQYCALWALLQE